MAGLLTAPLKLRPDAPFSAEAEAKGASGRSDAYEHALPLSFLVVAHLIGPTAGDISLAARGRRLTLRAPVFSVHQRMVAIALCLAVAPTLWVVSFAYTTHTSALTRDARLRGEVIALELAAQLGDALRAGTPAPDDLDALLASRSGALAVPFLASSSGTILRGAGAEALITGAPALGDGFAERLDRAPSGSFTAARLDRALAYRRVGPYVVGVVTRPDTSSTPMFLTLIGIFVTTIVFWAPLCARLFAGMVAGPIAKMGAVIGRITEQDDVRDQPRIPVLHRDEIG